MSDQGKRGLREAWDDCLKYLKRGGTENRGEETKIINRGPSWAKEFVPEKSGSWNSLTKYCA